jgi:hypothetical protein
MAKYSLARKSLSYMAKSISRQQSNFVGRDPLRLLDLGLIRSRRPAYRYATLSRQASRFSSVAPTFLSLHARLARRSNTSLSSFPVS